MNADLLRLLRLLVESMPMDEGADGYTNDSREQREAREILRRLELPADAPCKHCGRPHGEHWAPYAFCVNDGVTETRFEG